MEQHQPNLGDRYTRVLVITKNHVQKNILVEVEKGVQLCVHYKHLFVEGSITMETSYIMVPQMMQVKS